MQRKLIGAILIFIACGGLGFRIAAHYRREENTLRQIVGILEYMGCELQYRLTPLPTLCRLVSEVAEGAVKETFLNLSNELEAQLSPDAERCMAHVVENNRKLLPQSREILLLMGKSLGKFDIDGQLKGLESAKDACRRKVEDLSLNRDNRLRSYQTLGLCAGAALAILFL